MDTVFYGLPEERNRPDGGEEQGKLEVVWHDGELFFRRSSFSLLTPHPVSSTAASGSHEAHVLVKHDSERKECNKTTNLVIRTVWRVQNRSAIPDHIHIPSEIWFLND